MKTGDKVTIQPEAHWLKCKWFPEGEVTGTVQKVFKNGKVAVSVDQIRNTSEDGCLTLHFEASEVCPYCAPDETCGLCDQAPKLYDAGAASGYPGRKVSIPED